MEWMLMPYRRYADFKGRSRRKEYWMFVLFTIIVGVVLGGITMAGLPLSSMSDPALAETASIGPLGYLGMILLGLFWLASIIPSFAVTVRRFHDQDKTGWFVLMSFIPYIGGLIILVFMLLKGTEGPNRYGPDPKDPHAAGVFE